MQNPASTPTGGGWQENPARVSGILWTYILPVLLGSIVVTLLGAYLLVSGAPWAILAVYVLGYIFTFGLIARAIAHEPNAVAILETGLRLRYGLRRPWHEMTVSWGEVERFTMGFGFGAPVLIAYFRHKGKCGLGFVQREIIQKVIKAHAGSSSNSYDS